jgi:hypothetical protein
MNKSFRGRLEHDAEQVIRLSTNNGLTGYKIVKFQVVTAAPGTNNLEHILKIYKYKPGTIDGLINFDDPTLMAVAVTQDYTNAYQMGWNQHIIFDEVKVNQDIFITHHEAVGNNLPCNYYIELEQVTLAADEAAVATLKDMRGSQ